MNVYELVSRICCNSQFLVHSTNEPYRFKVCLDYSRSSYAKISNIDFDWCFSIGCTGIFFSVTPQAFAHQRQLYTIGGQDYLIVIGSLNEPIFVDDKSGVELRVLTADPNNPMNSSAEGAAPVEGLEETFKLKLELATLQKYYNLEPAFGEPGAYESTFYPTVATTLYLQAIWNNQ